MKRLFIITIIAHIAIVLFPGCDKEMVDSKKDIGENSDGGSFVYTREMELSLENDDSNSCNAGIGPYGDTIPGGMIANCFVPPSWPIKIKSARFFVGDYYGIPTTEFGVRVFREAEGRPGSELSTALATGAAAAGNRWASVDLESEEMVLDSGNFCVAMEWLTCWGPDVLDPDSQMLCADNDAPQGHTWIRLMSSGVWDPITSISSADVNAMIRVSIRY